MKTSRIDLIALNGATGEHYKYEEVAEKIITYFINKSWFEEVIQPTIDKPKIAKILVENFPDD